MSAVDVPIDVLFPSQRSYDLREHPDHIISDLGATVVGPSGTLFMADLQMGEVKQFGPHGSFVGILGSSGQGPGEYVAPLSLSLDPTQRYLGVGDIGQRRVVVFDLSSSTDPTTLTLTGPFSPYGLALGYGDTMFVVGPVAEYRGKDPYAGVLMAGPDSVVKRLLPVPAALQHRELGKNVLMGKVSSSPRFVFMGLSGSPVLYRYSFSGALVDSLRLPQEIYDGVTLPALGEWEGETKELREYARTQEWVTSIAALNDSVLVVALGSYVPSAEDWQERMVLVQWDDRPEVRSTTLCECQLLAVQDDQIAVAVGGGEPYTLQWRTVATNGSH